MSQPESPHEVVAIDGFIGRGLNRPECALAHESGLVLVPDWTGAGGVSALFPDGSVKRHLVRDDSALRPCFQTDESLRPNGICLLPGGSILCAHLGDEWGGVVELLPDGTALPWLMEVNGERLPPTNFVICDQEGRTWITVSTRLVPRARAYRRDIEDGFIVLARAGVARVVADDLGYTNECLVHPDGHRLFVNETFARRLTRFDIGPDGSLTNRTVAASFDHGTYPDGLAFDENGDAWITSIISNRVVRVRDSHVETLLQDVDESHLEDVEQAYATHSLGRSHLDRAAGRQLQNVSNLAFLPGRGNQAVLGCLLGDKLARVSMPVNGAPLPHWTSDIAPLITALETLPEV